MPARCASGFAKELPWLTAAGLLNRCAWGAAAFRPGDVAALKTAPAFVDSAAELFAPLLAGVTLVTAAPAPWQQSLHVLYATSLSSASPHVGVHTKSCALLSACRQGRDGCAPAWQVTFPAQLMTRPRALVAALAQHRVTHLTAVPTLLDAWTPHFTAELGVCRCKGQLRKDALHENRHCSASWCMLPTFVSEVTGFCGAGMASIRLGLGCVPAALRHITSSGEPLTWDLAEGILRRLPGTQLLNVYGSSEVGADATVCDVSILWRQRQQAAPDARPASHSQGKGLHASSTACVPVGVPLPRTLVAVVRLQSSGCSSSSSSSSSSSDENADHGNAAQQPAVGGSSASFAAAASHDADAGSALLDLADPGKEGEVWVSSPGVAAGRFPCAASHGGVCVSSIL